MAKLGINTGSNADDGTGDSLRVGAGKINSNFNEVYSLLTGAGNNGSTLLSGIVTSITAGTNISLTGGPTGAIQIASSAVAGSGKFVTNSTGIHTLGSVGIGTTTAENNGLSVLGNVKVGKGVTTLNLNVSGVSTFSGGDINISGDNYTLMWDASVDTLEFGDNAKIAFGAGSDLTLYHDGSNSYVKDQAAGNLYLDSNGTAVVISKAGAAESMADFQTDGPVRLFYNNARKFETISTGATVVGDLHISNGVNIAGVVTANKFLGDGSGLSNLPGINTSGTSNFTNLRVSGVSTFAGNTAFAGVSTFSGGLVSDGDATFKGAGYNMTWDKSGNELNFPTTASNTGRLIFGSTSYEALELKILSGVPIIQSHNQGITLQTDSGYDITLNSADDIILKNSAQVNQNWYIKCTESGGAGISSVALYAGPSGAYAEKLRTDPGGIHITGVTTSSSGFSCTTVGTGVSLAANVPVTFTGGSGKTLKIYRDASNSYITHESGDFYIQGEAVRIRNAAGTEQIANFYQNAGTTLYHDDSLVFSTDKHGVIISGIVTATSLVKSGGTSSQFLKADGSVDSTTYPSLAKASAIARVIGPGWNPAGALIIQPWNNCTMW